MKEKFPKFLKMNPTVMGLGVLELGILILGMLITPLLGSNALLGFVSTILLIIASRLFTRSIDFRSLELVPYKRRSLEWISERRKLL